MQHINYSRNVRIAHRYSLNDFVRDGDANSTFSVFGGNSAQRSAVICRGIARIAGQRGVAILHDDPELDRMLPELARMVPRAQSVIAANRIGQYSYDPLYRMSRADILDMLIPYDGTSASAAALIQIRSIIQDYLSIMEWMYAQNSAPFGASPYNLDLLVMLTSWPYSELASRALGLMNVPGAENLRARLSAQGSQQIAWQAVINFAQKMEQHLWQPTDSWGGHTRTSLYSAAEARSVISIRVSGSDPELMRLLGVEINAVIRAGIPLTLAVSGLMLGANQGILQILSREPGPNFTSIIASATAEAAAPDHIGLDTLLARQDQVIVFPVSDINEARHFAELAGGYYRRRSFINRGLDFQRDMHYNETETLNIRPEELISGKTLLLGRRYRPPVLCNSFNF